MKNIKFTLLLIISLVISSCGDDDSSREFVDNETKTELVGTLSLNRNAAAPGTLVSFNYTLPQSFEVESTLEVTATSSFGVLEINPSITVTRITVPAGQTSGTGNIVMPGNSPNELGFAGAPDFATVSMTGIALTQPEEGSVDDPFVLTSEAVSITGLDFNDPFEVANEDTLMLSLDWEGPYGGNENDLDLFAVDANFNTFENSETGTRFEGDFFNNPANEVHPDGDYSLIVQIWTTVDANPVPWRLVLTHPDGSVDLYEGTVDAAAGFVNPVGFTKSTDAEGNVTFTTFAL